jgi:putative ABC transport system permease protein
VLVANTLAAVVGEETMQIGVIKSLGGRRWQIILTYLAYAAALGAIGTVIGLGLGLVLGREIAAYLTHLTGLTEPPLTATVRELLLAVIVGTLVTLTASLLPVIGKANERVAPLIRTQGVRNDGAGRLLRAITRPMAVLSTIAVVGTRNALRRPARTASTVIVVTVAVAAFVATQALSRSVAGTVDELYALYGADAWVSFERGADIGMVREIESNPWVVHAEPWTSASASIGSTRTDVWGMPERDTLYSYRLIEGTWFSQSNPPGVVLTSNLADAIGARVGETRVVDIGARAETVRIVGIVDDSSTYLGNAATGKVFMNVADVNRLRGLGQRADIFALKFTSSSPDDVDRAMASIEDQTRAFGPVTYASYADQESSRQAINVLTLMLNAMVIVVAFVGIAGIVNTLLISIAERRREFGVLRALGARTTDTVLMLVSEGVLLALLGLAAGTLAGYPLARVLVDVTSAELFELSFTLTPSSLLLTFAVALTAVAATSALPGIVAARIRPIQVLRYE